MPGMAAVSNLMIFCSQFMSSYANKKGNSGVKSYEIGEDFIIVQYTDGDQYLYDYEKPGAYDVENMKKLAIQGFGLATYISQHVKKNYSRKL
jgi:hypothetical protein